VITCIEARAQRLQGYDYGRNLKTRNSRKHVPRAAIAIDPYADAHGDTKLRRAVHCIREVWQNMCDAWSTQLVFCDLSTPDPVRFNVYDDLRARLIAGGVTEEEIAFIHDADTDAAKLRLFTDVNAGRVRILIGSTEKMGTETNVQRRLVALHHLDAPWRPRDTTPAGRGSIDRRAPRRSTTAPTTR
jgi:hypothetical protein